MQLSSTFEHNAPPSRRLRLVLCGTEGSPVVEGVGGLEHCLLGWAAGLSARHDVTLVSVGEGAYVADVEFRRLRDPYRDPGPYGGRIPWGEPYRLPGEPFTRVALASPADLPDFAVEQGVDLVSLHNTPAWVAQLPVPAALTLHSARDSWVGVSRESAAHIEAGLSVAAGLSATSGYLKAVVADVADRDDVAVTAPFAHDVFLNLLERPRQRAVLYASRLEPKKGIVDLAAVWRRMSAELRPPLHVVDSVSPSFPRDEVEDLRSLVRTTPSAALVPAPITRAATAELVADHAVIVVPSVWDEPFSMVLVEAQAAGCHVVGYDSGGLSEAAGPLATLVPRGDLRHLGEAVLSALDATPPYDGRDWVEERFTLRRSLDAFEGFLVAAAR